MSKLMIHGLRNAVVDDAARVCDIYNHYVQNTCITFEEEPVSIEEMKQRINNVNKDLIWLVYEENNEIKGYAYITKWRVRSAYRFSVESTVYVDKDYKGQRIGYKLYSALLEQAGKLGIHVVIGGIALPNEASVKLHEKFGFEKVAQLREVGFKHNQWVDVGYWEFIFNPT
jgi:phosphinothricin acetyltransferase